MAHPRDAGSDPNGRQGTTTRRERIEAEIYEHAARLFAERGFAGTAPQDIADSVGVSRQSLYYYFKNKEEILAGLVSEMAVALPAELKAISERPLDPTTMLRTMAHLLVTDRATNRTRFRLLDRSESALPPELAEQFLQGRRSALATVMSVIDRGVTSGHFRVVDTRVAALSVVGMCNWVAWWFEPGPGHPVEPVADQIADSAVAMLRQPGQEAPLDEPAAILDAVEEHLQRLRRQLSTTKSDV